jgi:hypothetical protein
MKRNRILAAAVAASVCAAVPAAHAQDEPSTIDPTAKATFLSNVKRVDGGKQATLKVRYTCNEGEGLWISAKQAASRKKDKALTKEGSSQVSVAYLMSHRNPITCDGEKHTATFAVDKVEEGTKGKLKKGKAYVQFCITTETGLTYSKNAFVTVK